MPTKENTERGVQIVSDLRYHFALYQIRSGNKDATGARVAATQAVTSKAAHEGNEPLGSTSRQSQQGQRKLH